MYTLYSQEADDLPAWVARDSSFRSGAFIVFGVRIQSSPSLLLATLALQCGPAPVPDIQRSEFAAWLRSSEVSPYAAIYHQPFSGTLVLGPSANPPLSGLPAATLEQGVFRLTLERSEGSRTVARNRPVPLGDWHVLVSGNSETSYVTVFQPAFDADPPGWFAIDSSLVIEGLLEGPEAHEIRPMLGLDGVRVEAALAGTLVMDLANRRIRLVVYRMPEPGSDVEELSIFFRDETNGRDTYSAGRFLTLRPLGNDRYVADFNRARNPFCAYNSIYPCPLPWRGNDMTIPIEAGEKYHGGGLEISG